MFKNISILIILISFAISGDLHHSNHLLATDFNLFWLIPFIGILLSIALIPLINQEFWHHHYGKVSFFWAFVFFISFLLSFTDYTLFYILEVYLREFLG